MSESDHILTHHEVVSNAGNARAEKLSPQRRSEIAKMGGMARHYKNLPRATHGGILKFGDKEVACGVLPDKRRVISVASIRTALGLSNPNNYDRKRADALNLPTFLASNALKPYCEQIFSEKGCFVTYINKSGTKTEGMEATFFPKICDIYLKARRDGKLLPQQLATAVSCEIILSALANVGIISLVDESSGYQEERARDELQILLQKFISEDLLKWTKRFPHQFFREVYRLHGWSYREGQCRHPSCLGNFINKYIYEAISPEVFEELKKRNPIVEETGRRIGCHHQLLTTDTGVPALDKQLGQVVTILKISDTKEDFKKFFKKICFENK